MSLSEQCSALWLTLSEGYPRPSRAQLILTQPGSAVALCCRDISGSLGDQAGERWVEPVHFSHPPVSGQAHWPSKESWDNNESFYGKHQDSYRILSWLICAWCAELCMECLDHAHGAGGILCSGNMAWVVEIGSLDNVSWSFSLIHLGEGLFLTS